MKTNSKEVTKKMTQHIIECVTDLEGNEVKTIEQAREIIKKRFNSEFGHPFNVQRFPNHQERFFQYLLGMPFNFEYGDYEIKQFLNNLGINPKGKEYTDEQSHKLYSYLIFKQLNY